MSSTIGTNILSLTVQRSLSRATQDLSNVSERLSSGQRINRASDDAAGLSIASSLNADTRIFNQGVRNLNDGLSSANIAEGAMNELGGIILRIEELAAQSINGTYSDQQRGSMQQEVTALQAEWNRIVKSTSFNGRNLLSGDTRTVLQGGKGGEGTLSVQVGKEQLAGAPEGSAGGTTRVSTSSSGGQGNLNSNSASISADGRYVAFQSNATNLVAGDTNGTTDIFVKDLQTGNITRVSTSSSGGQGNLNSNYASISADGRYVAFWSNASNLVAGDTNGTTDIFVKDLQTGNTTRVSTSSSGGQGNSGSHTPSISADGRYVAFESAASNLVAGDTNGTTDIFVKDLQTGNTTRVSTSSSGVQGDLGSGTPSISADGRYVAFQSTATNLVDGDTNFFDDIFVKDLQTGSITRVSTSSSGGQGDYYSRSASISADGRYVAFDSLSSNLVDGDTNTYFDVFVKDLQTGNLTRLSTNSSGGQGDYYSRSASISADGRYVVFDSGASNLVDGDTNGISDIFLKDLTPTGLRELAGLVVSNKASAKITLNLAQAQRAELLDYRSKLGATISRISTFVSTLQSSAINYKAAASRITDADIAAEAATSVAAIIRQQVAASLLGQANQAPEIALALLRNA